jgi:cytochrome c553
MAMRNVLKWIGILLGGLLALAFIALVSVYFMTEARINKTYNIPPTSLNIPAEPELGERKFPLMVVDFCRDCHGQDLAGQVMENDLMIGRLVSTNLTAGEGGIGDEYTPEDWERALRHGVGRDNESLIAMPSNELGFLSDEDLGAIVSIIENTPPIDNELPQTRLGPMGRIFLLQNLPVLTAEFVELDAQRVSMPEPGVTVEYGGYLAQLCSMCHGKDFSGSDQPGAGLNLTPAGDLANWSEADFFAAMRTGLTPDGKKLDQEMMPVGITGKLSDEELKAIWLFLQTLPPVVVPTPTPEN